MKNYHVKTGPFMKSKNKTSKIMKHLVIALLPIIIFAFYKNGIIPYINNKTDILGLFYPLIFILVSAMTTYITEYIGIKFFLKKPNVREYMKNSYSIIPGLFLGLILPINTPISILIFGGIVTVVIGKLIYGGFGNNIFNPALIGRLFIIFTYAAVISSNGGYLNSYEVDTISHATPLTNQSLVEGIGNYETLVEPYGTLNNFFIGTIPGSIGETSALLCIIAFIYLTLTKVIKWKIPVFYIGTVFIMTFIIGGINNLGIWYPLYQVLSGGLFFGAIFMATDPVTSPVTKNGQIIYGVCLGLLTVIFRYLTPLPEGVLTSILTMNMLNFIVDDLGIIKSSTKKLIVAITILVLGLTTTFYIASKYNVNKTEIDINFNIVDTKTINSKKIYTVTQKGNNGLITADITFIDDKIININVIDEQETPSYYQLVIDSKYIDKLISEQKNIADIDTVSGATVSSTALKKMVTNTIKHNGESYEK